MNNQIYNYLIHNFYNSLLLAIRTDINHESDTLPDSVNN